METQTNFTISQDSYEGPFEKLVSLVEKRKLHISKVSLADIADEYIAYVRAHELELRHVSQFVVVAATLMLLKSRSLLPDLPMSTQEEEDIEQLQERLKIYTLFQELGRNISDLFAKNILYKRHVSKKPRISFCPDPEFNTELISIVVKNLITEAVKIEEPLVEKKVVRQKSLKEITEDLRERISRYVEISFSKLSAGKGRKETAASFLAVLELFRQGAVILEQGKNFDSIMVSSNKNDVPYYGNSED